MHETIHRRELTPAVGHFFCFCSASPRGRLGLPVRTLSARPPLHGCRRVCERFRLSLAPPWPSPGTATTPAALPATPVTFLHPSHLQRPGASRVSMASGPAEPDGRSAVAGLGLTASTVWSRARGGILRPRPAGVGAAVESSTSVESSAADGVPWMLSSMGWGRIDSTATGVESGSRRRRTSRGVRRWRGSSFWEKVMRGLHAVVHGDGLNPGRGRVVHEGPELAHRRTFPGPPVPCRRPRESPAGDRRSGRARRSPGSRPGGAVPGRSVPGIGHAAVRQAVREQGGDDQRCRGGPAGSSSRRPAPRAWSGAGPRRC